ncbi:unnamed protein product [Ranitomeya imitator]|uniref:Chromo domain-containing protein n=1 Tax=Ranitomeya imitator TaxID=111125 RepID=A0ABN9LDX0_9NEOB|nr:unnamed protein product [Ranitomeya imitator]
MRSSTDAHRRPAPTFAPGDLVWLSARNIRLRVESTKFAPLYLGPFKVLEQVNPVVYCLALPPRLGIIDTFHVSLLKPIYMSRFSESSAGTSGSSTDVYEVNAILGCKVVRGKKFYLVDWKGYGPEDRSREPAENIQAPQLIAAFERSKVQGGGGPRRGGNVRCRVPASAQGESRAISSAVSHSSPAAVESAQRRRQSQRLAQSHSVQRVTATFPASAIEVSVGQQRADAFGAKSCFSLSEHAQGKISRWRSRDTRTPKIKFGEPTGSQQLVVESAVSKKLLTRREIHQNYPRLNMAFQSRQEEVMFHFRSAKMEHKLKQTSVAQQTLKIAIGNVHIPAQAKDLPSLQKNWIFLTEESLTHLSTLQEQTVKRINIWKRQQQMAGNGAPFDESLHLLQDRVEFIFGVYNELYCMLRELKELEQRLVPLEIFNQINAGIGALIKSSFLVDKQPPQVLKTQTKFQASVNFMLGSRILTGVNKMPMIRASIITEKRAQELFGASASTCDTGNDGAGEIENGRSLFEFTQATQTCGAVFKNMLLKKIKRCERKGSESVTEEKCAILFTAEIHFSGATYIIQALSLPLVVIVHGNQDNNAKATILWDNAFSEIVVYTNARQPFYVQEKVPWRKMCTTLNMKFMSEVGTKQELSKDHFWFLAQKIFGDNCLSYDDLKEHHVSWTQFNKLDISK